MWNPSCCILWAAKANEWPENHRIKSCTNWTPTTTLSIIYLWNMKRWDCLFLWPVPCAIEIINRRFRDTKPRNIYSWMVEIEFRPIWKHSGVGVPYLEISLYIVILYRGIVPIPNSTRRWNFCDVCAKFSYQWQIYMYAYANSHSE